MRLRKDSWGDLSEEIDDSIFIITDYIVKEFRQRDWCYYYVNEFREYIKIYRYHKPMVINRISKYFL